MKVEFIDIEGKEHKGTIPEETISELFVRLRNIPYGIFTVYKTVGDTVCLMLYRPVSAIRPDLVLETYFTEDTAE